jgi:hypothetical protein
MLPRKEAMMIASINTRKFNSRKLEKMSHKLRIISRKKSF